MVRTRDDILLRPQQSAHALLLHVAIILLEVFRETKGDDRQAGVVLGTRLPLLAVFDFPRAFVVVLPPLAVDVAHANIPPSLLQRFAQQPCVRKAVLHDVPEAIKAEMDEVVVLCNDLRAGPREVKGVGLFGAAQIVQLEDEVAGEVGFVAPDYPTYAGVDQPEFMAGCVDGFDARDLEVPVMIGG